MRLKQIEKIMIGILRRVGIIALWLFLFSRLEGSSGAMHMTWKPTT